MHACWVKRYTCSSLLFISHHAWLLYRSRAVCLPPSCLQAKVCFRLRYMLHIFDMINVYRTTSSCSLNLFYEQQCVLCLTMWGNWKCCFNAYICDQHLCSADAGLVVGYWYYTCIQSTEFSWFQLHVIVYTIWTSFNHACMLSQISFSGTGVS